MHVHRRHGRARTPRELGWRVAVSGANWLAGDPKLGHFAPLAGWHGA